MKLARRTKHYSSVLEYEPLAPSDAVNILYRAYSFLAKEYVSIPTELLAERGGEDYSEGMLTILERYQAAKAENPTERYFRTRHRPVPFRRHD